jgi:leucyl-tRNA synthetase
MEHTTLHLLYSRFWHKFLYDIGVVPTKEPYMKRTSHGMILGMNPHNFDNLPESEQNALIAEYGSEKAAKKYLVEKYGEMANQNIVKMSKSLGNVVNPDDVIKEFGADTLRLYVMFLGDFEKAAPWSNTAVKGCKRFLDRVWNLAETRIEGGDGYSKANEALVHRTIKKVTEDIESMKFNTAIAALMAMVNEYYDKKPNRGDIKALLSLLCPFAPHIVEELWEIQGFGGFASLAKWPKYDESKMVESEKEIAVQVNGKLKTTVIIPMDADEDTVFGIVTENYKIQKAMEGMQVVRRIFVKNKLVNLILKPIK